MTQDLTSSRNDARVQIVGPGDGWILERLARKLASKLPYAEFVPWKPRPTASTQLIYYVNYALYEARSGLIDVGYFTHCDESHQFLERARQIDFCVSMSRLYADWLKGHGIQNVVHIPMGFDSYRYRPRLILGVVGLLDHPRKGAHLVEHLRRLPFVQILTTEGRIPETQMRHFYERVDFVLIPATVEGGPMSLLEGLGLGKPVIAPDGVGMVPEFADSKHIRRYPTGNAAALEEVVRNCFAEKMACSHLVKGRTWDDWAESHHHLFNDLLNSRGLPTLAPALSFRFGMFKELDLPWDIDLEPLEDVVDRASAHLFFGRDTDAKGILAEGSKTYPCLNKLLSSIFDNNNAQSGLSPDSVTPRNLMAFPRSIGFQPTILPRKEDVGRLPDPTLSHSVSIESGFEPTPRILMIAHVGILRDRMDKSHYYRYEALCRRPGVKLFGPGLPGYRRGMHVDEVIQMTFARDRPDLIIHGGDLRDSGIPLVTGLEETDLPTAIELLDTWANPDRTISFIQRHRFNIGLIQEAGPHIEFYRYHCPETVFFWTPNGVDTSRFRDFGLPKEHDIILYGVLEPNIYPFRTRLTNLLTSMPTWRVKIIKHPGYYPGQEDSNSDPVVAGIDLAQEINRSWIGIATRSVYNCLLMKYLEIAASGAAVAGNMPDSGRDSFNDCLIELREEMSDEAIIATLNKHLADKDRLRSLIEVLSERVSRDFSTEAFAVRVIEICRQVRRRSMIAT